MSSIPSRNILGVHDRLFCSAQNQGQPSSAAQSIANAIPAAPVQHTGNTLLDSMAQQVTPSFGDLSGGVPSAQPTQNMQQAPQGMPQQPSQPMAPQAPTPSQSNAPLFGSATAPLISNVGPNTANLIRGMMYKKAMTTSQADQQRYGLQAESAYQEATRSCT